MPPLLRQASTNNSVALFASVRPSLTEVARIPRIPLAGLSFWRFKASHPVRGRAYAVVTHRAFEITMYCITILNWCAYTVSVPMPAGSRSCACPDAQSGQLQSIVGIILLSQGRDNRVVVFVTQVSASTARVLSLCTHIILSPHNMSSCGQQPPGQFQKR